MLSPNALRVLDSTGRPSSVYQRIQSKGYNFDKLSFLNNQHELQDLYYFGEKKLYGYHGLRIYRQVLIKELANMVHEREILVYYERKYFHIVSEDAFGVTFEMANGEQIKTDMLIGADGIYSSVRKHITDVIPVFSGVLAITAHIPAADLRLPMKDYPLPCTIQGRMGGFVIAPQNVYGSELLIGTQRPHLALDRQGWQELFQEKEKLMSYLTTDKDTLPDVVQSAMEAAKPESINMWPFYAIPRLVSWSSPGNRIVLIGDSAYAIPPSAGQGVNQAFEDAYTLAILMASLNKKGLTLKNALKFWQDWRSDRVAEVNELTAQMNNKRLPEEERNEVKNPQGGEGQLAWLYKPKLEEEMDSWVQLQAE